MILKRSPLVWSLSLVFLVAVLFSAFDMAQASSDDRDKFRLHKRFAEDAAIPHKGWVGGGMDTTKWDVSLGNWTMFGGYGVMEFTFFKNLAIGARYGSMSATPENFDEFAAANGHEIGATFAENYDEAWWLMDSDVWLKYRFRVTDALQITPGFLVNIPMDWSDKSKWLPMQGGTDFQFTAAARYDHEHLTLTALAGVRVNDDFTLTYEVDEVRLQKMVDGEEVTIGVNDYRVEGDVEGKTAIIAGLGVIIPCTERFAFIAEVNYESESYKDGGDFIQFMFGPEIEFWGHRRFRASFGINLNHDGTPYSEFMMGGGATF